MSLLGEIHAKLVATTALTTLVPAAKIKQEHQPQGIEPPFITITTSEVDHGHDLSGVAGYADSFVEVNIWARKISDRDAVAEQVRLALDGYSGLLTTLRTQGIILSLDTPFYESDRHGGQDGFLHRIMQFTVMGAETAPA